MRNWKMHGKFCVKGGAVVSSKHISNNYFRLTCVSKPVASYETISKISNNNNCTTNGARICKKSCLIANSAVVLTISAIQFASRFISISFRCSVSLPPFFLHLHTLQATAQFLAG